MIANLAGSCQGFGTVHQDGWKIPLGEGVRIAGVADRIRTASRTAAPPNMHALYFTSLIFTGQRLRADSMAACRTFCVSHASAKSGIGTAGRPPASTASMSAAWLTNVCSYP